MNTARSPEVNNVLPKYIQIFQTTVVLGTNLLPQN